MEAQNITSKLQVLKNLPKQKQISAAILLGSAVADAAIAPVHWVYDTDKIAQNIGDKNPEFWEKSLNPFYRINRGQNSVYFASSQVMINLLADKKTYDEKAFKEYLFQFYGSETSLYQQGYRRRLEIKEIMKRDNIQWTEPLEFPWINQSLITFVQNYKENKEKTGDTNQMDPDGFMGSLPFIAQQISNNSFDAKLIENVIAVITSKDETLAFGLTNANILKAISEKQPQSQEELIEIVKNIGYNQQIQEYIQEVLQQLQQQHTQAVAQFGKACGHPGNFKSALHSVLTAQSYVQGIRQTLVAGGDNCSRGGFVGACLGAKYGIDSIPVEWIQQLEGHEKLVDQLIKIFS